MAGKRKLATCQGGHKAHIILPNYFVAQKVRLEILKERLLPLLVSVLLALPVLSLLKLSMTVLTVLELAMAMASHARHHTHGTMCIATMPAMTTMALSHVMNTISSCSSGCTSSNHPSYSTMP